MNKMVSEIDSETQLLIGVGAAVAAGCIPCLETMVGLAEEARIDVKKLKSAAILGQYVKEQPAAHMADAADKLLGTHLRAAASKIACPAEASENEERDCGCQTDTVAETCGCN